MQSLELIPEAIEDDFGLAMDALVGLHELAEASDDDVSVEELEAVFTDEVMDSIEARSMNMTLKSADSHTKRWLWRLV